MTAIIKNEAILHSPAAVRNRDVILATLKNILPSSGKVLEFGSGSGEHVIHFAREFPDLTFQPSDRGEKQLASIAARLEDASLNNIFAPIMIDLEEDTLKVDSADAVLAINVVHVSPWSTTLALLRHAANVLPQGKPLILYGPYHRSDVATVPSNQQFDQELRSKDACHGLRHLDDVVTHAEDCGFRGPHIVEMPANNICVVFTKL